MKPPREALGVFLSRLDRNGFPAPETVPTVDSLGRITSEAVFARISSPHFHTAAMDGFAVQASSTFGAGPDRPVTLHVGRNAFPVNTGRPLPRDADAVIMIEHVNFIDDDHFEIEKAVVPWENVRRVGEDFVASEMILPAGKRIAPYHLGALLAAGVYELPVMRKPRVLLIPTGSELIHWKELRERVPREGEMVEYNTVTLSGLVASAGGVSLHHPIVPDDVDALTAAVEEGVRSEANMVVINAGSSAGSEDYTAVAISKLGEVLVHGVAMMPGKPTILGVVNGKPVIGNPGYPVSAVLSFEIFGVPVLEAMQGIPHGARPTIYATTARKIPSKLGSEEFIRVKLGRVGDKVIAGALPKGAGSITTLTRADGILRVPPQAEGIDQGASVEVELLRDASEVERTIVVIGSHDLTLDILGDELGARNVFMSSSHVGSMGGLLALKHGHAHAAPSHLLDVETGVYNWSYIRKTIPNIPVRMFQAVMREQGFIVRKGNPKRVLAFEDLAREDVTFVNRQAGAGTRVLLDYHLDRLGVDRGKIKGYRLEEYTHTGVAVAVLSGVADAGMGVLAAARALDLDFIPVAVEEYDLIIPEQFINDDKIQAMLETMRSKRFRDKVLALGGYGVDRTGEELKPPA
jgi:putative molybdopterin biosynthesis protein